MCREEERLLITPIKTGDLSSAQKSASDALTPPTVAHGSCQRRILDLCAGMAHWVTETTPSAPTATQKTALNMNTKFWKGVMKVMLDRVK